MKKNNYHLLTRSAVLFTVLTICNTAFAQLSAWNYAVPVVITETSGSNLTNYQTLIVKIDKGNLYLSLNRPQARNAMNSTMVQELIQFFKFISDNREIRCVVIRGSNGFFCAGADIKEMAAEEKDEIYILNRAFGKMISAVNNAPQVVIAILEGAVLGGGLGLACVSDIAITLADTKFSLPETTLGLPPAQIAPFVVQRIGLTQARALALTGNRFNVHLIPETLRATTFGDLCEGHVVNIEIDSQTQTIVDTLARLGYDRPTPAL